MPAIFKTHVISLSHLGLFWCLFDFSAGAWIKACAVCKETEWLHDVFQMQLLYTLQTPLTSHITGLSLCQLLFHLPNFSSKAFRFFCDALTPFLQVIILISERQQIFWNTSCTGKPACFIHSLSKQVEQLSTLTFPQSLVHSVVQKGAFPLAEDDPVAPTHRQHHLFQSSDSLSARFLLYCKWEHHS